MEPQKPDPPRHRPETTPTVIAGTEDLFSSARMLGPYELRRRLGKGGMGSVYEARDTRNQSIVALKVCDAPSLDPWRPGEAEERFRREVIALAKLRKHPHLVAVLDYGTEGRLLYYAMELLTGGTFSDWLASKPRSPKDVVSLVHNVTLGLAFAHEEGLVHRDIKPDNILIDGDGRPRLADFGLVRNVTLSEQLTHTGEVLGTVHYMAPEQASGEIHRIGPWTDVHAIGCVLYEGLCGAPPFDSNNVMGMLALILHRPAAFPEPKRREIPEDLQAIVLRCLEKDGSRRYPDAGALARDLERWLEGKSVWARGMWSME